MEILSKVKAPQTIITKIIINISLMIKFFNLKLFNILITINLYYLKIEVLVLKEKSRNPANLKFHPITKNI
jgi:hypothetical protein